MKRWTFLVTATALSALLGAGCATLDERQRQWIFQPSDRSWGNSATLTEGMEHIWIDFYSRTSRESVRLHGLWHEHPPRSTAASSNSVAPSTAADPRPILLYLHGAKFNVAGSAPRIRRMHELGFSVLAIDYRGFGKSTQALPSEASAREDALAAWQWLAQRYPDRPRYIFGHSLGGAIGIDLAAHVQDEAGTIVESTFSSIADVVSSFKWGWLPFSALVTQRFEAARKVKSINSPLLVVHGTHDRLINPALGQKLYEAATGPKMLLMVEGGSHHNTGMLGSQQYRVAMQKLFKLPDLHARHPQSGSETSSVSAPTPHTHSAPTTSAPAIAHDHARSESAAHVFAPAAQNSPSARPASAL